MKTLKKILEKYGYTRYDIAENVTPNGQQYSLTMPGNHIPTPIVDYIESNYKDVNKFKNFITFRDI